VRELDRAEADLTRGLALDSTNYGILYHLGVLRYVRGDFAGAADAFARAQRRAPDPGELAGATDWRWMSLARAGRRAEADAMLRARPDSLPTTVAYRQRLRLYRGEIAPDSVLTAADTSDVAVATLSYGVGNWYLVQGDRARARAWLERAVASGGWPAFGFIAAEADLRRLPREQGAPASAPGSATGSATAAPAPAAPLAIGETFTVASRALGEVRRVNVYAPPGYAASRDLRLPVLYMPDGGLAEDFLHVAGLVQVLVGNGTMRPFLLVGVENTERRRDMTGPTERAEDRRIAPRVGGSAAFRRFVRDELMPQVRARYRTTGETAIVGESLAGLFVVETFLREPDLFDTYVAFDPSLWWDGARLVAEADAALRARPAARKTLYLASSDEPELVTLTGRLAAVLRAGAFAGLTWRYVPMPEETHGTIYHPAALRAFRQLFAPTPAPAAGAPR
jgi:predicted alpha/beta superfamily hydrolase